MPEASDRHKSNRSIISVNEFDIFYYACITLNLKLVIKE